MRKLAVALLSSVMLSLFPLIPVGVAGGPTATYSATRFAESAANDGSINETITITLSAGTIFTYYSGTSLTFSRVANIPAGLTAALVVGLDRTYATLNFTGKATAHANANDISNLSVTFYDTDFTPNGVPSGANRTDLIIDFDPTCYTISGSVLTNGSACSGAVTIPDSVTSIGTDAFINNTSLTSVTFGNSVETISVGAFYNTRLTSVIIPNSVRTIGDNAFRIESLISVTLGESVTSIGQGAFRNTRLTALTIPNSVKIIDTNAFYHDSDTTSVLASITVGSSVETISAGAFFNNIKLKSLIFLGNPPTVGGSAFTNLAESATAFVSGKTSFGAAGTLWNGLIVSYSAGPSANANLSALTLSSGTISPSFLSSVTTYSASVSYETTSVTVTPTKSDSNASIQVKVNSGGYAAVSSGTASSSLSLNLGSNTIYLKVTAEDGTTLKTYTISVIRAAPTTLTLPPVAATESYTVTSPFLIAGESVTLTIKIPVGLKTATNLTFTVSAGPNALTSSGVVYSSVTLAAKITGTATSVTEFDEPIAITLPAHALPSALPMFSQNGTSWTSISETTTAGVVNAAFMGSNTTLYRNNDPVAGSVTIYSKHLTEFGYKQTGTLAIAAGSTTLTSGASTVITSSRKSGDVGAITFSGTCSLVATSDAATVTAGSPGTCTVNAAKAAYNEFSDATASTLTITITAVSSGGGTAPASAPVIPTYHIKYLGNGNNSGRVPATVEQEPNSKVIVSAPPQSLIRRGYTFKGWGTSKDGSGTIFKAGDTFILGASDQFLYAFWAPNTYLVTFLNSLKNPLPKGQFVSEGVIASAPTPPSRKGFLFKGWSSKADRSDIVKFPFAPGVFRNVTLYAAWEKTK